jgi:hypothetical protein
MGYTLGQAAKAVGMSKTSILRSIKAGRISAGRDEFGQWAIEPCELHRVYPPLADDTGTGNGTEERGVTGGETALAEASTRATLAEARLSDFKSMLDDIREQRRPVEPTSMRPSRRLCEQVLVRFSSAEVRTSNANAANLWRWPRGMRCPRCM